MKKKIAVVTGTRAEYGLLYWAMKEIQKSDKLQLLLVVTGMHLSLEFGETYLQIEKDGFRIDKKVDMLLQTDTPKAIAKSMGIGMIGFSEVYEEIKPDILLVLGDRYEILCAVTAAIPFNIPIAHISGGEITEGAYDEQIRHAITKMAHIHFPGAEKYSKNIIGMGEEEWRIHNVGDPGIENIKRTCFIEREKLFKELNISLNKKTFLVTLHPTTHHNEEQEKEECRKFFNVLKEFNNENIVITYPNSDNNGKIIIDEINQLSDFENIRVYKNLGSLKYLSLMKESDLVIGNSSSGYVEAPFLKVPTIDFGDRQKGRLRAKSIIHVNVNEMELRKAIESILYDKVVIERIKKAKSLYGEGETSKGIVEVLENVNINSKLISKKLIVRG